MGDSGKNLMQKQSTHGLDWPGWSWLALSALLLGGTYYLHLQGRPWWCACGEWFLWSGDVHSRHNSQHLADPYSFTHVLHGVLFCGALVWGFPRMDWTRRFQISMAVETFWELVENSSFIVDRYRATNIAQGYEGDSIVNSLGDIACAGLGFALARQLGWKWSIAICVATEVILLFWIRDNLFLSGLMLVYPFEAINAWQMGQ
jgi:hypothetical protein